MRGEGAGPWGSCRAWAGKGGFGGLAAGRAVGALLGGGGDVPKPGGGAAVPPDGGQGERGRAKPDRCEPEPGGRGRAVPERWRLAGPGAPKECPDSEVCRLPGKASLSGHVPGSAPGPCALPPHPPHLSELSALFSQLFTNLLPFYLKL